jgi:hypothetical protein
MAVTTWTELKASIAGFLNRTDLTTAIADDFIPLAEAEMKRRIRRMTESTTIYISAANMDGPTDLAEPISLRLDTGSPSEDIPLKLCTPQMLAEVRARVSDVQGRPTHFSFYDEQLQFAPVPDQSYDGILVYYQQFTSLGSGNATNTILSQAPDAYLYGSLLHAQHYLEHPERLPEFQARFDAAIQQMNEVAERESYGGAITDVRLPVTFG